MEKYPLVFVHGMFGWGQNEGINKIIPYWGATTGSVVKYLTDLGYECYAASVGPLSSAWDQACELYAQLMGTRVDYGEVHSKKHGHMRYGRTYKKPLFENWSKDKKVHLIGHSFGGNAIRLLIHFLTHGDEEELSVVDNENVSPLFRGGNESLVSSVTAICSPMNGTNAHETAERIKLIRPLSWGAYIYSGLLGRSFLNERLVDFHLEHFELTNIGDTKNSRPIIKIIKEMMNKRDNIAYDMSQEGAKILNDMIKISNNVYYYSYLFSAVKRIRNSKAYFPVNIKFPFLLLTSVLMLKNSAYNAKKTGLPQEFENDGLVNVNSAMFPENEPSRHFDGNAMSGIWNVMPTKKGDHGTPIGLFIGKKKTRRFYTDLLRVIEKNTSDIK